MRNSDSFSNPLLASARCDFFGLDIATAAAVVGTVASVATGVIGLSSASAASAQAAANAQAVANYNAQIQEQNADLALQMAQYQASQNAAIAEQQNALIQSQQKQAQQTAQANASLLKQQQQIASATASAAQSAATTSAAQSALEAQISRSNAAMAELNATYAKQQADAAQKQYEAGLENAKQFDAYGEQIQAQQREEARRIREESDTRNAQIRAKYAGGGVTFEGSPLVVLADSARLSETMVQDAAFISELEARKQFREAEIARFEAPFSLLDKQGFLNSALGYEIQASAYETEAVGHELAGKGYELEGLFAGFRAQSDIFGLQIEVLNQQSVKQQSIYEGQIQQASYETQLAAVNYDTLVAGERHKIALQEADLTRFAGAANASTIMSDANATLISGIGSLASNAISGVGTIAKTWPKTSSSSTGAIR